MGSGLLEKYALGLIDNKPSPLLIYKMSVYASNNITFDKLMIAAGYTKREIANFKESNKIDVVNFKEKKIKFKEEKRKNTQKYSYDEFSDLTEINRDALKYWKKSKVFIPAYGRHRNKYSQEQLDLIFRHKDLIHSVFSDDSSEGLLEILLKQQE